MKEFVKAYLEYVNRPENQCTAHRNMVSIHLENGNSLKTCVTQEQSVNVITADCQVRVKMGQVVYVVDGREMTPVEYAMVLLFGKEG